MSKRRKIPKKKELKMKYFEKNIKKSSNPQGEVNPVQNSKIRIMVILIRVEQKSDRIMQGKYGTKYELESDY